MRGSTEHPQAVRRTHAEQMMQAAAGLAGVDEQHALATLRRRQRGSAAIIDVPTPPLPLATSSTSTRRRARCYAACCTSHVATLLNRTYGGSSASETTGRFGSTGSTRRRTPTRSDGGVSSGSGRPSVASRASPC